jgi:hypothetical protein
MRSVHTLKAETKAKLKQIETSQVCAEKENEMQHNRQICCKFIVTSRTFLSNYFSTASKIIKKIAN